jgi:hypothetical protein
MKKLSLTNRVFKVLSKKFCGFIDELKTIFRTKPYRKKFPVLFSMFAIIEQEQNPQVFELNLSDFRKIKHSVFPDIDINNYEILDALINLFRAQNLHKNHNKIKSKIADFLFLKLKKILQESDSYYSSLVKAMISGFPFLLNKDGSYIIKLILSEKSKHSFALIKYIFDDEFCDFFIDDLDVINILFLAYSSNNRPAFMLLVAIIRKRKLFHQLFNKDSIGKIIDAKKLLQKGISYSGVLICYIDDEFIKKPFLKNLVENFFSDIFLRRMSLEREEMEGFYLKFKKTILLARSLKIKNHKIEELLDEIAIQYVDAKKDIVIKENIFTKFSFLKKPSKNVKPKSLFRLGGVAPEEYWMIENI